MPDLDLEPSEYRERKWPREWPMLTLGICIGVAVLSYLFMQRASIELTETAFAGIVIMAAATGALVASLFRRWL